MHLAEVKGQVGILGELKKKQKTFFIFLFFYNKNRFHFQETLFTLCADGDKVKQPRRDVSGPADSTFLFPTRRPDRQTGRALSPSPRLSWAAGCHSCLMKLII